MKNSRDFNTLSPWQQTRNNTLKQPNQASEETIYDTLIIGGGITGITTALMLQQQGKKCMIAEGHNIGYGTTGGTTAHINTFFDSTYPKIESNFSEHDARLVANAGRDAIKTISSLVNTYNIDCDLETKTGYLFSQTDEQTQELADILKSAKNAGVSVSEAKENGVPIEFQQALQFDSQAQFHPLKYITALVEEFIKLGGCIAEQSFVRELKTNDNIHTAYTSDKIFRAHHLVYATHVPPGVNKFSFRCAPYLSYVLGIKLKENSKYPKNLAYDMQEPYHYFRTHVIEGEQILILGGGDHKTGQGDPEKAYKELEDYASNYFDIESIVYRWSSQYYVPVDGLPYIGPMNSFEDTIYVATGFNGNGMTWGTIAGTMICDAILGIKNPYATLFMPSRMKPIAGFTEFVKEGADVVYRLITDQFNIKDIDTFSELGPDEGKVIEFNGEKMAVYKDTEGHLTALNPTCTHAGCTVSFNAVEKSWDCPCHGGRFSIDGKVLTGPPSKDLLTINLP